MKFKYIHTIYVPWTQTTLSSHNRYTSVVISIMKLSKLMLILSELLFWPETHKCNFLIVQDTLAYRVAYKAALLTKDKLQFA